MKLFFSGYRKDGAKLVLSYFDEDGKIFHFIGDCTVWSSFPAFKRQPTLVESELSDQWQKIRYNERAPGKDHVPLEHSFTYKADEA